ncbi:MAG: hypothetical protein WBG46_15930 [Nonlabens sp.]
MKRIYLSIIVIGFALTSCKESDEKVVDSDDIEATSLNDSYDNDASNSAENENNGTNYDKSEASEMARQMKENVQVDKNNDISIKNFTAYGELQNQVKNLSIDPSVRSEMNSEKAKKAFETFKDEMPAYLNTVMVRKEVDDAERAMTRMYKTLENGNASEKIVKKHINKVKSSINDLNQEIVDIRLSMDNDDSINFDSYSDFVNSVSYDDNYRVTILEFEEYDKVSDDRMNMDNAAHNEKDQYAKILIEDFSTMISNMPEYIKIDDVEDAVEDVQKEMREYQEEKGSSTITKEENQENLEEIDEALYDLNKELIKARKKYDSQRNDAIENYMEELNG